MAQITLTVNPIPADAEVKINGTIGKTSSVESGSDVSILVSKSGYSTLEIIDRYTESKTVDVELQTGDDLEPTVTIIPKPNATVSIDGSSGSSKTVTTGASVDIKISKYNYVTYEETLTLTHNLTKIVYLEEGRCWFVDNSDRTVSGSSQEINPPLEVKTNASKISFSIGNIEYLSQEDSMWVKGSVWASVSQTGTFSNGFFVKNNLSGVSRSALVHLSPDGNNPDPWDTVKIIQDPLPVCIVKDKIDVSCDRNVGKLSVCCASQSNSWTVSTDSNWIALSGTVGTGDSINGISYTIAENPGATTRRGEISIYTGSAKVYSVPVTQELDPSVTRPSVDKTEISIDTYEDTDITLHISDPLRLGWKLDGYTNSTIFRGVLNPNNWVGDPAWLEDGTDFAHPEFGKNPPEVSVDATGSRKELDGIGDSVVRVLFSRKAWYITNTLLLCDDEGVVQEINFIPTSEVKNQRDAEYGDPNPKPEPEGVTFPSYELVLDMGDPASKWIDSDIYPSRHAGKTTATHVIKDVSIAGWGSGGVVAKKAGVTYIWGRATRSDGTTTPESKSGKIQVVVWDKNNLTKEFQFESHSTIVLDYGNSTTIKLLKKSDSKLKASDICFYPPNSTYSVEATDSSDGSYINVKITAGAKQGRAWLMAIYGSIMDKVAINVPSIDTMVGPMSGYKVSTQGHYSVAKGTSSYWTPNFPVMYQFEYDPDAKVSPPGLTLMEGEVKSIRGTRGTHGSTVYNIDKYHLVIRGDEGCIRVGDLVQIDTGSSDRRYEFVVEGLRPGISYVDLVYNDDETVNAVYMIVVKSEDGSTLRSINLSTTDPTCIPGKSYNLGFSCIPHNYSIRDYNSATGLFTDRPGISLYTEKDDPYSVVESCSVVPNPDRSNSGNAYYNVSVKFKSGVSGRAGIRLGINDNGNRITSNTLILNVSPDSTLTSGTIEFSQESIEADISDGAIDLSQYLNFSGFSETDSRYYYLDGSDGDGIIRFSSDGKSIIPAGFGNTRVYLKYHYFGMEGSAPALKGSGSSILVNIRDRAEEEVQNFNIRFKVREVRIDRSARIYYRWASESPTGFETSDFSEQLYSKYNVWKVKDLITYDDPNGVFDRQRLVVRYENEAGQNLMNENIPGYDVAYQWAEGTVYLAAYYGTLRSTASVCRDRIPFVMETRDRSFIPIRHLEIACRIPDATLPKWSDFSQWYPFTKFFKVYPKDATISECLTLDSFYSEVVHVQKYNPGGITIDDAYRIRLAGLGGKMISRIWRRGGKDESGFDGGMILCWPDGTAQGNYRPNSVTLSVSKNTISRGEYTFVHATPDPDLNFAMKDEMEWKYTVDGKTQTRADVNKQGIFNIICETRRGVIIQGGLVSGTHTIKVWMNLDSPKRDPEVTITMLPSPYNSSLGVPKINIQRDSSGCVVDNQVATLVGGDVEGWACDNWGLSSITQDGLIRTFTAGTVTYYAVTTDGRLARETVQTKDTITGWEPIDPHSLLPVNPVDDTPREAAAGDDSGVQLGFEDKAPITFDSSADEPVRRKIRKGGTTFSLSSISCAVEKPGIVSATCVIYEDSLSVQVTPLKKGTTKVYVLYGGTADYVNVEVLEGEDHIPSISYKDSTGVSLNAFEYKEVEFRAISQGIYDEVLYNSDNSKILVDKGNYDPLTGTGTFLVTLKDKVSGKVTLQYNTEHLEFQVVNRYNLAFEDVSNFILGVGATRYIKIYPLDDLIQDSEVYVSSQNGNVTVGTISESRDSVGKRVFIVPVTYKSSGPDVLIASRKGDIDIYLEFDCEAASIPASSVSFNTDSINLTI
jgi:hypothetical protein